jgi:predicted permease
MPADFRYPGGTERIWRALDPRGPLANGFGGVSTIARLAGGATLQTATTLVERRSEEVGKAAGAGAAYAATPAPLRSAASAAAERRMLLVLVAAALCVLLIACANVASLELAGAVSRARTCAIRLAIGASHASLVRSAFLEGLIVSALSAIGALFLTIVAVRSLIARVAPALATSSANPIDVDPRGLVFMAALAALAWMLSVLPVVAFTRRVDVIGLMKLEGSSVAASRGGARLRRGLTVAQIAVAVVLLVGSVLYIRSYRALMMLEKGFDSSGLVSISLTIPPQHMGTPWDRHVLAQAVMERLHSRPGVLAAFEGAPPPNNGDSPTALTQIEIDDRPPIATDLLFPKLYVESDYFKTLRIPLLAGRLFEPGDSQSNVIISRALAARLWAGQDAIGRRFREAAQRPWYTVVGVVGHVRLLQDGTTGPQRYYQLYFPRAVPKAPLPSISRPDSRFALPSFAFMNVTARVDSPTRAADVYQTVRSVDPRNILKLEFVDEIYTRQFADRLLATRIVGSFGVLAFVLAAAGIYGLMAFLVAIQSREMGIRMALGADGRAIAGLVLGSSLRLVALGAVLGVAASVAVSRWVQSQLYGVSAVDPATLAGVVVVVGVVAAAATWHPARQACRVDPTELLRS